MRSSSVLVEVEDTTVSVCWSAHLTEDGRSEHLGLGDDVGWLVCLILPRGEEGPLYGGEGVAQFLPRPRPRPSGQGVAHMGGGAAPE